MALSQKGSNLNAMPPEIRNRIYEHLLPVGRYFGIGSGSANTVRDLRSFSQVNRLFRNETLPMFFGNTEFLVSIGSPKDLDAALRWLSWLENWQVSLILDLTFYVKDNIQVHFTAQPDTMFQRSGVTVFSHHRHPDHGWQSLNLSHGWLATCLRPIDKAFTELSVIVSGIRSGTGIEAGDSGLRVFHVAKMFLAALNPKALTQEQYVFLKRLGDRRKTGTWLSHDRVEIRTPTAKIWASARASIQLLLSLCLLRCTRS